MIDNELGWGAEGLVYSSRSKTAIKSYLHENLYLNERNVYFRLRDRKIDSIDDFTIPKLINWDDTLWVVEMSIVSPPFILDFAGSYLDRNPPFGPEEMEEWEKQKVEQFEEGWPAVRSAMASLRRHGIHLADVKPGNIMFAD